MTQVLSLIEMMEKFEEAFPQREWVVAKKLPTPSRSGYQPKIYRVASMPAGYVAVLNSANPDLIVGLGETVEDAFESMMLRTTRRYNKDT